MEIRTWLLLTMLMGTTASLACDVCGAAGSNSLGILPGFKKHFVSLRWNESSFVSRHTPASPESGTFTTAQSKEFFNVVDLWGRFYVHKRVQIFAFVPLAVRTKIDEDSGFERLSGLSDVSLLANYVILNTGDSLNKKVKHGLQAGGGIKLPTGRFGVVSNNELVIPNMQPGSGSFDVLFNAVYTLKVKSFGVNYDVNYRINTANKHQYRFGNRTNTALRGFYWKNIQRSVMMPYAGVYFEHADKDTKRQNVREYTGGQILAASIGMDVFIKNFGMGFQFMQPIHSSIAQGYVTPFQRWTTHVSFLF